MGGGGVFTLPGRGGGFQYERGQAIRRGRFRRQAQSGGDNRYLPLDAALGRNRFALGESLPTVVEVREVDCRIGRCAADQFDKGVFGWVDGIGRFEGKGALGLVKQVDGRQEGKQKGQQHDKSPPAGSAFHEKGAHII